jgi:Glycosyl hydrolase family 12
MFRILLSAGIFMLAVTGVATPAQAQTSAHARHETLLCKRYQHIRTKNKRARQYVIRNDDYGHKHECIRNRDHGPNFTVTREGARVSRAKQVSYPNIFVGCSWGICSKHSGLPRRVKRVRKLVTSWSIRAHARGTWGAAYDIWFDRTRATSGQSRGAELMIWLDSRGFAPNRWPIVTVNHVRYHLAHWIARGHGVRWHYIQFRLVRDAHRVRNLNVKPFIRLAERDGLIKRNWWLANVEAGFEIWKRGVGLGTKSFSVRM